MYSPLILSLSLSHRRGSASAAEPPGCSSPSLSLLEAMAAALLLLLALARLRFGTSRPDELTPPARARFFYLLVPVLIPAVRKPPPRSRRAPAGRCR